MWLFPINSILSSFFFAIRTTSSNQNPDAIGQTAYRSLQQVLSSARVPILLNSLALQNSIPSSSR
jgi:hypothetical protein